MFRLHTEKSYSACKSQAAVYQFTFSTAVRFQMNFKYYVPNLKVIKDFFFHSYSWFKFFLTIFKCVALLVPTWRYLLYVCHCALGLAPVPAGQDHPGSPPGQVKGCGLSNARVSPWNQTHCQHLDQFYAGLKVTQGFPFGYQDTLHCEQTHDWDCIWSAAWSRWIKWCNVVNSAKQLVNHT